MPQLTNLRGASMLDNFRLENDGLGEIPVPQHVYYGAHTERARKLFSVSGRTLAQYPAYLTALARVKKAAALANADAHVIPVRIAAVISQAADEIIAGSIGSEHFPIDILAGGGGVSFNRNLNEVLAARGSEILTGHRASGEVSPGGHVNASQSTGDVLFTALHLALHSDLTDLLLVLRHLQEVLEAKVASLDNVVKASRTCLQDATPITFGQEFSAYLASTNRGVFRLERAIEACLDVTLGSTAIGTGVGAGARYQAAVLPRLAEVTGLELRRHPNPFDDYTNADVFLTASAQLRTLAGNLSKFCRDLRLMASGPRAGFMEIRLPEVQVGSSFFPGKINPTLPEFMMQISYQVVGNDSIVAAGIEGSEFNFNVWIAVIAKNLFESCQLLTRTLPGFTDDCVAGIQVDIERNWMHAEHSLGAASVVGAALGYETGEMVARYAIEHHLSVRESAIVLGLLSAAEAAELLDPIVLTDRNRSGQALDRFTEGRRP
ncbi:lyase family protein [Streptomyces sp. NPDC001941]|uniref:lyase family protein n=1 Tax=Streptomyces sp. NPDC001941 TaxID=3154659 RepID=UPI003332C5BA